jgi:hypothetical protein
VEDDAWNGGVVCFVCGRMKREEVRRGKWMDGMELEGDLEREDTKKQQ